MPKIGRFPSLGGNRCRGAGFVIAALIAATPATADDYSDGAKAFAAGEYEAAAVFWQKAARGGSAQAKLQLGLIADLGLGAARDPAAAFGYYMSAAQMGLPDAAFNVGVMLDAGTDVSRDRVSASVWYARAALAGNKRAALNLGLMYQNGSGVLANDDLAVYWFGLAAPLPAAKAALQRLKHSPAGSIVAPVPLSADLVQQSGEPLADLVWTAKPGTQGSMFAVQVVAADMAGQLGPAVTTQETLASAVQIAIAGNGAIWRVVRIDPGQGRYQASAWQHQIDSTGAAGPVGLVSFVVNAGDDRADALARTLAQGLKSSGLAVSISTAKKPVAASAVQYRYLDDAGLADDLAGLLPGFSPSAVTRVADLTSGPGEVVVDLVLQSAVAVSP